MADKGCVLMSVRVKLTMSPTQEILLKRGLNKGGKVRRFFTHEVRRLSDPYVPMKSGMMKDSAIENVDNIVYPQVYSKKQYMYNGGSGLRGKLWDQRMWADRGDEIVKSVAAYAGGKPG